MPKLCPKIILEGTRLTLKTEIAFALNEHPRIVGPRRYCYHSPIVSAEWCGFTNHAWGRGLINFEPHEEALAMETYRTVRQPTAVHRRTGTDAPPGQRVDPANAGARCLGQQRRRGS